MKTLSYFSLLSFPILVHTLNSMSKINKRIRQLRPARRAPLISPPPHPSSSPASPYGNQSEAAAVRRRKGAATRARPA